METALLMARASAVAILTHCLVTTISAFMLVRSVVTGVATRAIGLIGRELPGDHFCVALMAICAQEVSTMILRFVR